MIQAIGLTSVPRRRQRPAVDDLTFEARPGRVTVLLGPEGAGKTSALRLMLQLQAGRGVALFRGRPVHRVQHLAREIGVLLGDVPGHPARTARSHLRMLTAVAGVPAVRADDVLDVVGLSGLADQRLGLFSLGMDRRLGIAAALLGDPHTLVLDEPVQGLSPRETNWLYGLLRSYADQGGAVLVTSRDTREAARIADRVVTIDSGRLVADQDVADFARTRLRPRVAVHTPHAERLAALLSQEARHAGGSARGRAAMEVVYEGGSRISVYGSNCAAVGEYAYRHGILVHRLSEERGDTGDATSPVPLTRADGRHADDPADVADSPAELPAREFSVAAEEDEPTLSLDPITVSTSVAAAAAAPSSSPEPSPAASEAGVGSAAGDAPTVVLRTALADPPPATDTPGPDADLAPDLDPAPDAVSGGAHADETRVDPASRAHAPETGVLSDPVPVSAPGPVPGAGEGGGPVPAPGSDASLDEEAAPASVRVPIRPVTESVALPPPLTAVARPGPVAPLRYELRRLFGVRTTWVTVTTAMVAAVVVSLFLARTGDGLPGGSQLLAPATRLLTGWPASPLFFLSPAAVAAGLLGAFAFGHEFRYPALAPARTSVPRRLGLLVAKLVVSAGASVALCCTTAAVNAAVLALFFGPGVLPADTGGTAWQVQAAAVLGLTVGCAWAGVLAAGIFRSTLAGAAMVLAVPLLIAPAVRKLLSGPAGGSLDGLPGRLESVLLVPWPSSVDRWVSVALDLASRPVARALTLSLVVLACAYVYTALRSRAR